MKGYWIHQDRSYLTLDDRRIYYRYGGSKCNHFNPYVGYKKNGAVPKRIDVNCGRCGMRVQFNPHRNNPGDSRGKVRQAIFKKTPTWTNEQIALFCQEQNLLAQANIRPGKRQEGFTRASEWLQENQTDKGGDDDADNVG